MEIGGYQKLTLIDYPGKLATTVFTVGCSFRCPFCHNPELVLVKNSSIKNNMEQEFFQFLKKRRGTLDGVCVTGGEPTIQGDILGFMKKIKDLGYSVKLDTNGTRPDVVKQSIDGKLVDYLAMDIKNSLKRYDHATGLKSDIERIKMSVALISNSGIDYEFRTTVVPGIHREKDIEEIADWLKGSRAYYLQKYRDIKILDPNLKDKTKGKIIDLERIKKKIKDKFEIVGIRE